MTAPAQPKPPWLTPGNKVVIYILAGTGALALIGGIARQSTTNDNAHPVDVTYEVTGSASSADLTYTNSGGDTEQRSGVPVPVPDIDVTLAPNNTAYIAAQNTTGSGDITCRILVNGAVVKESTSTGAYTIATCSAQVS